MKSDEQAINESKIVLERTYRARVEDVWDLWTTKEGFESWWGPEGFRVEVHALEARAGGTLHYDMIADSSEMIAAMKQMGQPVSHPTRSRFAEVKPHQRLVLTNLIDFLPGVTAYESNIAVDTNGTFEQDQRSITRKHRRKLSLTVSPSKRVFTLISLIHDRRSLIL